MCPSATARISTWWPHSTAEHSASKSRRPPTEARAIVGAFSIATRGGNQSWNGIVKRFDPARCDYLFVHVADGRRWLIPAAAIGASTNLSLGGSKYSEFEIESGSPLAASHPGSLESRSPQGEYRSGQTGCAVNALAQSFVGSNPASPTPVAAQRPVPPTKRDRRLGKQGRGVINQKRRLTIPQSAFFEAGFVNEAVVAVRADGPGRIVVEQVELPAWAVPVSSRSSSGSGANEAEQEVAGHSDGDA